MFHQDLQAQFQATFDGYGEPIHEVTETEQSLCDRYRNILDRLPHIHFGFINDNLFGAWSARSNGKYFIAESRGAWVNICAFCHLLLSHPDFLPHEGNRTLEIRSYDLDDLNCDWTQDIGSIVAQLKTKLTGGLCTPRDSKRRQLADRLTLMANDFLVFHELGHILGGHLSLGTERNGIAIRQEVGRDVSVSENKHEQHALELLADELPFVINPLWRNAKDVSAWTIAVGILTVMLNEGHKFERGYDVESHPHPAMRLRHAVTSTFYAAPELKELAGRAWIETFENCVPLLGISSFLGLLGGEGDSMYEELFSCMKNLLATGKAVDLPRIPSEVHARLVQKYGDMQSGSHK